MKGELECRTITLDQSGVTLLFTFGLKIRLEKAQDGSLTLSYQLDPTSKYQVKSLAAEAERAYTVLKAFLAKNK